MLRAPRLFFGVAVIATVAVLAGCESDTTPVPSPTPTTPVRTSAPSPTPEPDPAIARARARLGSMTLRQKVASLLMLHTPGTDPKALRAYMKRYEPGGFILMGGNLPDDDAHIRAETKALTLDASLPPLIATDQEGGTVHRVRSDDTPGAHVLRGKPASATEAAFDRRGTLLASLGINTNFGIVADVTDDPHSFIAPRVLGTSATSAAERVAAAVRGEHGHVLSTLKHFPGHGETDADSHRTVPTTALGRQAWSTRDAPPFRAGIDAGAQVVMFGHLAYTAVDSAPASLSKKWHEILRDDLGFDGITITDDMTMLQSTGLTAYQDPGRNAVRALAAGNTMLLFVLDAPRENAPSGDPDAIVTAITDAVEDGTLTERRIDVDAEKLMVLRARLGDGLPDR